MRGTIERFLTDEIVLYKRQGRKKALNANSVRQGTAMSRIEKNRNLITNVDGVDQIRNVTCVFFFNDYNLKFGDYLSLPDETEVREIIYFDDQVIEYGGDKYVEARV